jgi:hypothetical protein
MVNASRDAEDAAEPRLDFTDRKAGRQIRAIRA